MADLARLIPSVSIQKRMFFDRIKSPISVGLKINKATQTRGYKMTKCMKCDSARVGKKKR
jgi:hypothetical protein